MLRNILAVVFGYIVMLLIVIGGLTAAYLAMGADRAFEPGNYEITTLWVAVWIIDTIAAALLGGIVCAKISKHRKGAILSLMLLIAVLGASDVVFRMLKDAPSPDQLVRTGDTPNLEAMQSAQSPMWVYLSNPIIGVVGVMLGAMMVCPDRKRSGSSATMEQ